MKIKTLLAQATPRPWAWDQRGEKTNEWGMGVALDKDENQLSGRFTDDDVQYVEYVCSHEASVCNYKDPELIATLANSADSLVALVKAARMVCGPAPELVDALAALPTEWSEEKP